MPRRNFFLPLLALGMVVLFTLILVRLLFLRYERGDVYPAYSTLRADPLGTRAFYEALQLTGRYQVTRGFASLHRELETKPNALFYLGLSSSEIPTFTKEETAELDEYVKNGGRVLLILSPENPYSKDDDSDETTPTKKKKLKPSSKEKVESNKDTSAPKDPSAQATADKAFDNANPTQPKTQQEKYEREELRRDWEDENDSDDQKNQTPPEYTRSLAALWGFGWERQFEDKKKSEGATGSDDHADEDNSTPSEVFAHRTISGSTEPNVPWKSALYFVRLEPDWEQLYEAKDQPVLIRRHWGSGDIIIATDSYFLSNEALRNDRRPLLLSLLAGGPGVLLFDESHLGTQEQEGIMALAEKFRLEGFLYGMIGVFILFLWRNSTPLVPPRATDVRQPLGGTISGKDSRSGLVNLLRRNIPPSEILKVCLTEWKRGVVPKRAHLRAQMSEMESIVTATTDHPDRIIQSYHDLSSINAPGKTKKLHATKS